MFLNKKFKTILLVLLSGSLSLSQILYTSSVIGIRLVDKEKANTSNNTTGLSCYLLGQTEIKSPTIKDLLTSKKYLDKKYSKGRISKEVYETRLKSINKRLEQLINTLSSRCINLAQTEQSLDDLELLYSNNLISKQLYDANYKILNDKMISLKTAKIENLFEDKIKYLDRDYKQQLFNKKIYNLRKEILDQEKQYCLNHLLYSFQHLKLSELEELRRNARISEIQFLRKKLKLLESLNANDKRKQGKKNVKKTT